MTPVGWGLWPNPSSLNPGWWLSTIHPSSYTPRYGLLLFVTCYYAMHGIRAGQEAYGGRGEAG